MADSFFGTLQVLGEWDRNRSYTYTPNQEVPLVFDGDVGGQAYYSINVPSEGVAPNTDPIAWKTFTAEYTKTQTATPSTVFDVTCSNVNISGASTVAIANLVLNREYNVMATTDGTSLQLTGGSFSSPISSDIFYFIKTGFTITIQKINSSTVRINTAFYGQPNKAKSVVVSDADNTINGILVTNPDGSSGIQPLETVLLSMINDRGLQAKYISLVNLPSDIPQTDQFDGYTAKIGDTILLTAQTSGGGQGNGMVIFNGVGVTVSYSPQMPYGFNAEGVIVDVLLSTTYGANSQWACISQPAIIGVNPTHWKLTHNGLVIVDGIGTIANYNGNQVQIDLTFNDGTLITNIFNEILYIQDFNQSFNLAIEDMVIGRQYIICAKGGDITINLTSGNFQDFTALGSITAQPIFDGESIIIMRRNDTIVQIL